MKKKKFRELYKWYFVAKVVSLIAKSICEKSVVLFVFFSLAIEDAYHVEWFAKMSCANHTLNTTFLCRVERYLLDTFISF